MNERDLQARVSYTVDGSPSSIEVKDGSQRIAHAKMDGSSAIVTCVYPWDAAEGVTGRQCLDVLAYLEELDFLQAAKFGEVDA